MSPKEYMGRLHLESCIVCKIEGLGETPAQAHHIVKNSRRLGHEFTIPLCYHHHQGGEKGVAFHSTNTATWENKYGTQLELLDKTRKRMEKNGTKGLPELKEIK